MKVYGNLINRISEHVKMPTPKPGDGVTIYMWSDRHAGTVTRVSPSGKTVWFTEDRVTAWEGDYGTAFETVPGATERVARLRKNGTWKSDGNGITFGARNAYRDPSF
jgi:hypothetical protein